MGLGDKQVIMPIYQTNQVLVDKFHDYLTQYEIRYTRQMSFTDGRISVLVFSFPPLIEVMRQYLRLFIMKVHSL